jgi:acyl-coenzyme A synthetase/AMP-(fatty) acid ligase
MSRLPVAVYGADGIVAVRAGQGVPGATFWAEVAALAARLPAAPYAVNLCADRYRFMVGFAAALARKQVTLMPATSLPAVLADLAASYPGLYALTDGAPPPLPSLVYPDDLSGPDAGPLAVPAEQLAVIQFTSGSTGKPKAVPKSWGTLVSTARAAGARLGVDAWGGGTLIGTVPHQHSYGLESVILLAWQHGLAVEAATPLYPEDVRAALARAARPRLLVTTPVHLRALTAAPGGMPAADLLLCATAPLPAALAAAAEGCFAAPLVEIYGCTEAGQVATRRPTQESLWHCLPGIALHQDEQGSWASGAPVEGVAPLQDEILLHGSAHFALGARAADLVNVAGKRASLAQLTQALLGIAGVKDGVFVLAEAPEAPVSRLAALVVAPGLHRDDILRALRTRIDAAFLPRPLVMVASLPHNPLGKLPRADLLALLARQ